MAVGKTVRTNLTRQGGMDLCNVCIEERVNRERDCAHRTHPHPSTSNRFAPSLKRKL